MNSKNAAMISATTCFGVTIAVFGLIFTQSIQSAGRIARRSEMLNNLAKYHNVDNCWVSHDEKPYGLGEKVQSVRRGKIPTSCILAPKVKQVLHVAYLDGSLQITGIFSEQELKNELSKIRVVDVKK